MIQTSPHRSPDKLTCTGFEAAVAAGSLSVTDTWTGPRLYSQHWRLLGIHTGRWGLADVRGGGRNRRTCAACCGSCRVSIKAGGFTVASTTSCVAALLLLLLLIQPLELFSTGCAPFLLHPTFFLFTAATGSLHRSRYLSGGLLPALTPSLVLVVSLGAMDQQAWLGRRSGTSRCLLRLVEARFPWD